MPFGGITNVRTNPYVRFFYLCLGVLYLNPLLGNLRQGMQAEDAEQKKNWRFMCIACLSALYSYMF